VYDAGPYVYAVDIAALEDGSVDVLDEGVYSFPREEWDRRYRGAEWTETAGLVPFYALASPSAYFAWRDAMVASAPASERDTLASRLSGLYRDSLETVSRYKFPAVLVPSTLEPTAVARIFERVNKTGLRLSAFDLVVARVYQPNWNLREEWERARSQSALIEAFLGDDGMPVLQVIALRYQENLRESAVLNMPEALVREQWEGAVSATQSALEFLVADCGVVRSDWLPYGGMLLPLAALAADEDLEKHRRLLRKWFFSRAFSLAFDAAANTRLVADYRLMRDAARREGDIEARPASAETLLGASRRRQGAIWRGFMCALAVLNARDLIKGDLGLRTAARRREVAGEQFTPISLLARRPWSREDAEPPHLRVLGVALAARSTAGAIRRQGFAQVAALSADMGDPDAVEATLRSQLLPPLEVLETSQEDWGRFLEERLARLAKFLRSQADQFVERGIEVSDGGA
jgi:hypothetical protein